MQNLKLIDRFLQFSQYLSVVIQVRKAIISKFAFIFMGLYSFSSLVYADCASTPGSAICILENINNQFPALDTLIQGIAYIAGMYFIIKGLFEMRRLGEARTQMSHEHSVTGPILHLIIGAVLMSFPNAFNVTTLTFFSESAQYPYTYLTDQSNQWCEVLKIAYNVIYFVGLIAFIRGIIMLSHASGGHSQQGGAPKALTHIIGGVFCMNIQQFLTLVFATLGQDNPMCNT